ncbi:MAG: hypothetical protein KDA52_15125, partial [Planctomycetaceae bacterium]|nr:hypothetical protein [Planctomycetaceae bacterium]
MSRTHGCTLTRMTPQEFIDRWQGSAAAEMANSQSFLKELCALLDVEEPQPTQQDESANTYTFEKAVIFNNGDGTTSQGRVDLYRQGCFVLESKQGSERKAAEQEQALAEVTRAKKRRTGTAQRGTTGWEKAMVKARQQARRYAEAIPGEWPPFLIVVDVGHCFDVYADFSQSGKNYIPFPDPVSYRIPLKKLADRTPAAQSSRGADNDQTIGEVTLERLRLIWTDPHALDPAKQTAKVTRELAAKLAELAKRLEARTNDAGEKLYTAEEVSQFLMRCLFTMFAEDVQLGGFTDGAFTHFLESRRGKLDTFVPMLESLWQTMD